MKVLKFLIIASIIAYTAARVVGPKDEIKKKTKLQSKQEDDEGVDVDPVIPVANIEVYEVTTSPAAASVEDNSVEQSTSSAEISTEVPVVNVDDSNPINRYCKCSSFECDCCREFSLPLVPIRGPGCANIRYLEGDRLSVGIKFGNRVLANRIVNGRKATPICLPLPGGFTNFCGKIYGISKKNENFKACLGLELRADEDVEAALRVSCFDFGPKGLRVTEAEPIPASPVEEEDDDDDDDFFGLGGGDDEDDDDDILGDDADESEDDDTPTGQSAGITQDQQASKEEDDDDDDVDYTGLSLLSGDFLDDILGDDEDESSSDQERPPAPAKKQNKKKKKVPVTQNASENEVNGVSDEDAEESPISRPAAQNVRPNNDSDDDDEDDEDDGGFLGILDDLISDGDDDESAEEQLEDEVSEEIVQNELEDDIEEIGEEVDDAVTSNSIKDLEANYDEQSIDGTVLDDDDVDEDTEDLDDDKPTSYSGLSLLGLRKFFSRFFH